MTDPAINVFISYAHDDDAHMRLVECVADLLKARGMNVFLDNWRKRRRNDWNQLTTAEIENADYVVAVASPGFRAAAEGTAAAGRHRAVRHEISIMRDLLQEDRDLWFHRIIPLVLKPWTTREIPRFLQPVTGTHVIVDEVSDAGLRELIELLVEPRTDLARPRSVSAVANLTVPHRRRWRLPRLAIGGAVLLAGAITGVVVACQPGLHAKDSVGVGEGNSVVCGQVSANSTCEVKIENSVRDASEDAETDAEFKADLARHATGTPTGEGPWPFVVVDTFVDGTDLGLFARTTNTVKADRLGVAPNRSLIWADCAATSDFQPMDVEGENKIGPRWLHVRWVPTEPMKLSASEPSSNDRAWMYRGNLVPVNHNGHIPDCK
jgi:hypothetical protein